MKRFLIGSNLTKYFLLVILLLIAGGSVSYTHWSMQKEPLQIEIQVLPSLLFSLPRFHVAPGRPVVITFTNTDDMDHNLLILRPHSRESVVQQVIEMGAQAFEKNYVPDSKQVLWNTSIVQSDQTVRIAFTAPAEEGVYPYVCTLPGHGNVMFGAMYVNDTGLMPSLASDKAIPPRARIVEDSTKNHPYTPEPPFLYRLYIDGASPAAIAVNLPDGVSYCWDADLCRMRFVWSGEFVDNSDLWKGHIDAKSKILGEVFYRESKDPVIVIGDGGSGIEPIFKGYRIVEGRYPEFHYLINGIAIFERIEELPGRKGIRRRFRIPDLTTNVYYHYTEVQGIQHSFEGRAITGGELELDQIFGKQFNVEISLEE